MNEVIEYVSKRSVESLPMNVKEVLTHLLLADVAHRSFMSKQELAYYVMDLPPVRRSFADISVIGFYRRSNITVPQKDGEPVVFSDRTKFSAYAERTNEKTVISNSKNTPEHQTLTKEKLKAMCYREFAETVNHRWVTTKKNNEPIDGAEPHCSDDNPSGPDNGEELTETEYHDNPSAVRRVFTRDISSGHWVLSMAKKRRHVRFSTTLYTDRPEKYEPVALGISTPQTSFFELPVDKRRQLYRSYFELCVYQPWEGSVEEHFITDEAVKSMLNDINVHPERDERYSLIRLEALWQVYKKMFDNGQIAPPNTEWRKDNQFSYSMFLTTGHNTDVHFDRIEHSGVQKARFEAAEELNNLDLDVITDVVDENDLSEYPSALNFLPPDTFKELLEQKAPAVDDIAVAFPLHVDCQKLQKLVTVNTSKIFMATPPLPSLSYDQLSPVQQWAVDVGVDPKQKILYICGKVCIQ